MDHLNIHDVCAICAFSLHFDLSRITMEDAAAAAWRGWKVATLLKPRPQPSQAHELLTAEEVKLYINLSARVVHIIREGDPPLLHPARDSFTLRYFSQIKSANVRLLNRLADFPHLLRNDQERMINQYGSDGAKNRPLISVSWRREPGARRAQLKPG